MMEMAMSMFIGYVLGSLNPADFIAKMQKKNLREMGTGNLGATNTLLTLGKKWGVVVMLFDIMKSVISVRLAKTLFPELAFAGFLAGCFVVIGHIFPFYLKFQGGKGVAAFAGMMIATDFEIFVILLIIAGIVMCATNYGLAGPISASVLFPVLEGIRSGSWVVFFLLASVGVLIINKHLENIEHAKLGTELSVSEFLAGEGIESKCEQK